MPIIKYLRLPFHFNTERLRDEVKLLADKPWQQHYQVKHYEGEWSAIPLRSDGGKTDNIFINPKDSSGYRDTVFLESSPYLQSLLQTFQCPLQAVRLLKLNAGAVIKEHRDAELNFEKGEVRFHIPIITHEDLEFYLDGERIHLKEGECWYMNFNLPHRIANNSPVNRIHLVIDAEVNDWLKDLFNSDAVTEKKVMEEAAESYSPEVKRQMITLFRAMNTAMGNKMADDLEKELAAYDTGQPQ